MKTKTSAAKTSANKNGKKAPAGSKLASLKGAVTKAIFGSSKSAKQPNKSPSDSGDKKKTSLKAAPVKSTKPVAAKATSKKTEAPAKAEKGKAAQAASAKGNGKAAAPAPATAAKGKGKAAAAAPAALTKPVKAAKVAKPVVNRISAEEMCREVACEALSTSGGYCRLHYIKNWKKIKRKELILKEGKLNQYIEELVAKYPDKYIEAIRQDLADDKAFAKVIYDLDLDESVDEFDTEGENLENVIDNIKGRDFDDEGETF